MKIFIIFLGLLLVNASIMSYKGDLGRYIYLGRALDNIAYECAEIAAHDPDEARAFADGLLAHTVGGLRDVKILNYACDISVDDEMAVASVRMDAERLFGFPFSAVTSVTSEKKCLRRVVFD